MAIKITDLNAVTDLADTDVLHLRNNSGLDKKITGADLALALTAGVMTPEVVDADATIEPNKNYTVQGDVTLTLPTVVSEGDVIEIYSTTGITKIAQSHADNIISFFGKLETTQGTGGYIELFPGERLTLSYTGTGYVPTTGTKMTYTDATSARACKFSPNGEWLAVAGGTTPFVEFYKRSGDTFTKQSNPASIPSYVREDVCWRRDSQYVCFVGSNQSAEYVFIYKRAGDTFTKLTQPSGLTATTYLGCAYSPDGRFLYLSGASGGIQIYEQSGDTFTRIGAVTADAISGNELWAGKNDDFVYASSADIDTFATFKRTGDTLQKIGNSPNAGGNIVKCSPSYSGKFMAASHYTSPAISIYVRHSDDTWLRTPSPEAELGGTGQGVEWSPDDRFLIVGSNAAPYVALYERHGNTFDLVTAPTGWTTNDFDVASYTPDGVYLAAASDSSPYLGIFKMKTTVDRMWNIRSFDSPVLDTGLIEPTIRFRFY